MAIYEKEVRGVSSDREASLWDVALVILGRDDSNDRKLDVCNFS